MSTSRRNFLATGAAAAGWTLLPSGRALATVDLGGGAMLRTLSDGAMTVPRDFIYEGLEPQELGRILTAHGGNSPEVIRPCNVTLLSTGDRKILFDLGAGTTFLPGLGDLPASLDEIGVAPDEITDVIFTHGHPDHLWGLLDDFDDLVVPDANYYFGQVEWDYWTDPATLGSIGAAFESFVAGATRRLAGIEDRVQLFKGGDVLPGGAVAIDAFGHTPGHMAFQFGGDGTLLIADTVVDDSVAFVRPEWPSVRDTDMETAIATRLRMLDMAATDGLRIVGFHVGQGGIGRLERARQGYVFTAEL